MIFNTLAALSDYSDDLKYNQSPSVADNKAIMEGKQAAGLLNLKNEVLTIGGKTFNNSEADKYAIFVDGLINRKTLKSVQEDSIAYA